MTDRIYNVLFLCTGNSARSILAESLLNHLGRGRFRAFSAGSHPNGTINPFVREMIERQSLPVDQLRSKSWDEFAVDGAPELDFVAAGLRQRRWRSLSVLAGPVMTAHQAWKTPLCYRRRRCQARCRHESLYPAQAPH